MRSVLAALALVVSTLVAAPAHAQYTRSAGHSAPMASVPVPVAAADGTIHYEMKAVKPAADRYGNAQGNQHDLAVDGAFEGQTVAVIQLYTGEGFDFSLPRAALKEKGFSVYRWSDGVPSPGELERALAKSTQLWIISGQTQLLTDAHLKVIKKFFDAGHGVYIWGDNEPYYADANFVAHGLLDAEMLGNVPGAQVVNLETKTGGPGVMPNHLITTGLEHLFEGITIATIQPNKTLSPLVYGSAGNLVTAVYDHDGKRAILDGGFTRLYLSWDTAGTARYVKNAAAWLANAERFKEIVANKGDTSAVPMTPVGSVPAIATVNVMPPSDGTAIASTPAPTARRVPLVAWLGVLAAAVLSIIIVAIVRRRIADAP